MKKHKGPSKKLIYKNSPKSPGNKKEQNGNSQQNTPQLKQKSSLKERLLPSILLSIAAPLSVCCVAPFEIYGGNLSEFKFILSDFFPLCLLIALVAAAVICTVLLLCRGRVFDTVYGLIFGITLMLFVQSNYLSLADTSLEGDGTGEGSPLWLLVLSTVLWVVIPAASVAVTLCLRKFKDTVRLVSTMVTAIMIFMSFVSFLTISLTTEVYADDKSSIIEESTTEPSETESGSPDSAETDGGIRFLTVENLNTFAKKENIVVFIVDRFDKRYYNTALKDCPEVLDELDGFTYFDDYISLYPRTFPAITHLVTGVETDFSRSRLEYFDYAYKTAPMLHSLKDAGYDINIYTDTYYGYEDASPMSSYVTNISHKAEYKIVDRENLSLDMLRLSLYRALPSVLRSAVGDIRTTTFDKYVVYSTEKEVFSTDMKDIYELMTASDFTFREADKGYSFIHISGCHLPNIYDENFNPVSEDDKWNSVFAIKQSFKIINEYISEMKRMGVYEDATIIITGDHASIGSDSKDPYYAHMTALLAKPSGVYEGSFESSAQISTENIHATIMDAAGLTLPGNKDCETMFEIPEDETRTRRYLFQRMGSSNHELIIYEINGEGADLSNWVIKDRHFIGKSIYK